MQMAWIASFGSQEKVLHLRTKPTDPWTRYNQHPNGIADYKVPGGSKGWATYQHLMKAGWQLVSTADALKALQSV